MSPEIIAAISSAVVAVLGGVAAFLTKGKILQFFKEKSLRNKTKNKIKAQKDISKLKAHTYNKYLKAIKDETNILKGLKDFAEEVDKDSERIERD